MFSGAFSDTSHRLGAAGNFVKDQKRLAKRKPKLVGVILTQNPTDANGKPEDANDWKDRNDANDTNDMQGPAAEEVVFGSGGLPE